MTSEMHDVASVVGNWTVAERKSALALLLNSLLGDTADQPIVVSDKNGRSVALVQPFRFSATETILDDCIPEHRELRRRIETWNDSMSVEEFLAVETIDQSSPN